MINGDDISNFWVDLIGISINIFNNYLTKLYSLRNWFIQSESQTKFTLDNAETTDNQVKINIETRSVSEMEYMKFVIRTSKKVNDQWGFFILFK